MILNNFQQPDQDITKNGLEYYPPFSIFKQEKEFRTQLGM
jgi:hypothetical protein